MTNQTFLLLPYKIRISNSNHSVSVGGGMTHNDLVSRCVYIAREMETLVRYYGRNPSKPRVITIRNDSTGINKRGYVAKIELDLTQAIRTWQGWFPEEQTPDWVPSQFGHQYQSAFENYFVETLSGKLMAVLSQAETRKNGNTILHRWTVGTQAELDAYRPEAMENFRRLMKKRQDDLDKIVSEGRKAAKFWQNFEKDAGLSHETSLLTEDK